MRSWIVIISCLLLGCTSIHESAAPNYRNCKVARRPEFAKYFDNCNVKGTTVISDPKPGLLITGNDSLAYIRHLPASTFKIINLLIALETKVINSENDLVKWPGSTDTVKYGYRPEIYHDMSVKQAFEVSAGWVFVELSKRIGRDNYKKYLRLAGYGNGDLTESGPDFWNFGNFGISPVEQVNFLQSLIAGSLPFSKTNMDIVKRVMTTESGSTYRVHSKTGWTRDKGMNTGWWVGYMVIEGQEYCFATLLLQPRPNATANFGSCRKEITKKIFREAGYLPASIELKN